MDQIKLNIPEGYNGEPIKLEYSETKEYRKGEAIPPLKRKSVELRGNIYAPGKFYEGKVKNGLEIENDTITVQVDYECRRITLTTEENYHDIGYQVTGMLKPDHNLTKFKINTEQKFTLKDLTTLLKMNRVWFLDRDANHRIVTNLKNFKTRVTQELEHASDLKGNRKHLFEQKVSSEFDLTFGLRVPIWSGSAPYDFEVEVGFDIRDAAMSFWLESVELKELQQQVGDQMMAEALESLKDLIIIHS